MSEKISEYTTSVTALASGDLMDVSKLISTSPDVYQSQKLNYSVLISELSNDLPFATNLQDAYDNSTQPQILTSIANGGVVIRNGQALDTNSVLEIKNIAGSSTFVVGGNGIVANGDWQATAIDAAFGGTGQTSYTIGDLIYASNTTAIAKLGIGTAGQVLTVSGSGVPSWATISSSNLGNANLTANAAVRSYTMSGSAATDYLDFLKPGGGRIARFRGDGRAIFGTDLITIDEANVISSMRHKLNAANDYGYYLEDSTGNQLALFGRSGNSSFFRPTAGAYMTLHPFDHIAQMVFAPAGEYFAYRLQANGKGIAYITSYFGHGKMTLNDGNEIEKISLYSNGTSYFINSLAIGNSTADASALLDIRSTAKGVALPRMTTAQKLAIPSPIESLEVYDLDLHQKSYYNGTTWINI